MKILLIEPPFARFMGFYRYFFPFSLCSLSAYLDKNEHDILIYDADHADKPVNMNSTDMLNVYHHYLEGIHNPQHSIWEEARKIMQDFQPDIIRFQSCWAELIPPCFMKNLCCRSRRTSS
jgi:hypothetical protein